MKYLGVLFLCCSSIAAQSLDRLQKYGQPVSVTYEVRPSIYATAYTNKDGEICELIVSPQLASETLNYPSAKTLRSDQLTEIINELVPLKERGRGTMNSFFNVTCLPLNNCQGATDNYENVHIFRNGGTDKERWASIQFVKPACAKRMAHNKSWDAGRGSVFRMKLL
jgi:hypothetical protein